MSDAYEKVEVTDQSWVPKTMGEAMARFWATLQYYRQWEYFADVVEYHRWKMEKELSALMNCKLSMADFLDLFVRDKRG